MTAQGQQSPPKPLEQATVTRGCLEKNETWTRRKTRHVMEEQMGTRILEKKLLNRDCVYPPWLFSIFGDWIDLSWTWSFGDLTWGTLRKPCRNRPGEEAAWEGTLRYEPSSYVGGNTMVLCLEFLMHQIMKVKYNFKHLETQSLETWPTKTHLQIPPLAKIGKGPDYSNSDPMAEAEGSSEKNLVALSSKSQILGNATWWLAELV